MSVPIEFLLKLKVPDLELYSIHIVVYNYEYI